MLAVGALLVLLGENNHLSIPFALCVFLTLAGLVLLATRRVAFAIYAGLAIIGILTAVSAVKYRMKGFSLHFYDAIVVAGDGEMYRFLFDAYPLLILPILALLVLAVVVMVVVYRADRPRRMSLGWRMAVPGLALLGLPLTFPAEASGTRYFYYLQGRHVTAAFVSLLDLQYLFQRSDLEARLAGLPDAAPFEDTVDCGEGDRPDVFLVLAESQTDPRIFPQIAEAAKVASVMEESVGPLRPLQVETFGGGTWISNLSLMTGLSATDFGWRSPYLTITLEGRVKGALPEVFARCGYRTAAILPLNYTFVNEGPFLRSIGFETILDKDDIGAAHYHLRDKFYYDAAETFIRDHRRTDGRPLFLLVQTMFPHSPYQHALEPDEDVSSTFHEPASDLSEYLRRMVIAHMDLAAFSDRRRAEASTRPSVQMVFGDHQVFLTKPFVEELDGAAAMADPRSRAYRTFFALSGKEPPSEAPPPVDIAFLGNHLLRAAGIPGTPANRDLAKVEEACAGVFYACARREMVDRHLKRRVDSGLLRIADGF